MTMLIARVTRGDRPGREWPVVERLRAIMGNAEPANRTHYEQTAADAIERIADLERALWIACRDMEIVVHDDTPNAIEWTKTPDGGRLVRRARGAEAKKV